MTTMYENETRILQPQFLVVGQQEADLGLLKEALQPLDVQLDWVADAEVAVQRLAQGDYALTVLLLPLPHGDGLVLCRRLRAADASHPLLLLQTFGLAPDALAAFEAGADAYLVAPLHAEEVRARVGALLRRSGGLARVGTPYAAAVPTGADLPRATRGDPTPLPPDSTRGRRRIPLRRGLRVAAAAALISAGVLGDRVLGPGAPAGASVAAASVAAPTTRTTTTMSTTAAALDAATEHAFAVASPSVVYVDNVGVGTGSGVVYDSSGDIVTNAHVVSGASKVTVTLKSGKTYTARIVGTDTADDLAVIHINASGLTPARFATTGSYAVAETVLAIGNPLDLQQSVTSGLISALNRTVPEGTGAYLPNAIQTSAAINPGNSGGALVDLSGAVVGIPTLEATDPQNNNGGAAQGIGFAVPSSRVTYVAHQIIATGTVAHTGRAYLGVAAVDAASAQQSQDPFSQGSSTTTTLSGALVQSVSGPAAQAGVQQGDVITALGSTPITDASDLLTALAQQKPGTTITLTLDRNGSTVHVRVTLGELPANGS